MHLSIPGAAYGDPEKPSDVVQALQRVEQALLQEEGLRAETKDALSALVRALQAERAVSSSVAPLPVPGGVGQEDISEAVAAYLEANPPAVPELPWKQFFDDFRAYGDLRLRQESDLTRHDNSDRNRQRIRLRIGANYRLDDEWLVGARLITGDSDDPNSPHVSFGDLFNSLKVSLDRPDHAGSHEALHNDLLTLFTLCPADKGVNRAVFFTRQQI